MSWSSSDRRSRLPEDWEARRAEVFRRKGRRCWIRGPRCKSRATDVDHIVPGEDHSFDNLRPVCGPCHAQKSSAEGHAVQARLRAHRKRPLERHPGQRGPR